MLYIYDEAICEDLDQSFNRDEVSNPVVKVCTPDQIIPVAAQIKEGQVLFPVVAITRSDDIIVDTDRSNFARLHKGVTSVIDLKTNELYYEKVIPIRLSYTLSVLTTNTADMDELIRELLFKYTDMYFLTIRLPYEANRKIRFGVVLDEGSTVTRESYLSQYSDSGTVYQSNISLNCEGCVLVNYTPAKLRRVSTDIDLDLEMKHYSDKDKLGFDVTCEGDVKKSTGFDVTYEAEVDRSQKLDVTVQPDINKSSRTSVTVQGSN